MERTYTFQDGNDLVNSELETELSNLTNALNGATPLRYLLFITPNGLHVYKAYVDNDGSWVTEQVS